MVSWDIRLLDMTAIGATSLISDPPLAPHWSLLNSTFEWLQGYAWRLLSGPPRSHTGGRNSVIFDLVRTPWKNQEDVGMQQDVARYQLRLTTELGEPCGAFKQLGTGSFPGGKVHGCCLLPRAESLSGILPLHVDSKCYVCAYSPIDAASPDLSVWEPESTTPARLAYLACGEPIASCAFSGRVLYFDYRDRRMYYAGYVS